MSKGLLYEAGLRIGKLLVHNLLLGVVEGVQNTPATLDLPKPASSNDGPKVQPLIPSLKVKSGSKCLACTRPALVKGLCQSHYRKATKLQLSQPYTKDSMEVLKADGRKAKTSVKLDTTATTP